MTDAYPALRFLIRKAGIAVATPLLAVLVLVEITDVIFAVDSIPAIFALTSEPFLIWVGIKMLLLDVFYIPTTMSLAVVVTIITVSMVASLRATRGQGRSEVHTEPAGVFRIAADEELAAVEPVYRRRGRVPAGSGRDRSDE
ncbi:tellurite resistance protein TerC [Cryobacterium flavum]|uniref:Tellurite resistance protein TerC n=1 Tax=Cryobacterium flavum TaxID=1424659 RepID=A0A5E9GYP2_9MICO|nr:MULTISPECIES: hypothetical protein [Cryobacterium]SDO21647.1 tellurite resistance protein TerC [Cryobacterium flavum]